MDSRRILVAVGLASLIVLSGCAGMGAGGDGAPTNDLAQSEPASGGAGDTNRAQSGPVATEGSGSDGGGSGSGGTVAQARSGRAIIKEGTMTVEVENFSRSRSAIAARARSMGGYVGGSNQQLHRDDDQTWRTGYVVVRVPSKDYASMRSFAAAEGTVLSQQTTTTDVSDKLVDLEARIENLEQRRERLRTFYDRANSTEELLRIEEELSTVQGKIERLRAQKRSLERRVSYSTIRIELREPAPSEPESTTQYHEQSLVGTFMDSVGAMYRIGRALLVTTAAAAPWLALLAVPVLGLRSAYRRGMIPLIGPSSGGRGTEATADPPESKSDDTVQDDRVQTDDAGDPDEE